MSSTDETFRSRLVRFYSRNNPAKLVGIDDLLLKYKGDEEALIQKIHLKYGVRDLVSNEAVDEIYENERYSFLNRTFGSTFLTYPGHLMVVDRKRWSTASGSPSSQEMRDVEPSLPDGYEWTGPWEIDSTYVKCDRDGWTYAFDFSNFASMLANDESHDSAGMTDYVRRRRWIRPRRRKADASQTTSEDIDLPTTIEKCISSTTEENEDPSTPAPPTYRFFSPTMTMEEHENAWTLHLQALDKLHTKLNHARAARILRWKKTKVELKAQVKQMAREKTHEESKIDQLKRIIWFPKEKGYVWRASLSGLFIGVHDFWIEHFSSKFNISMLPTSQIILTFDGTLRGRFDHIKVKGDKGTRIPDAKWNQLIMDVSFIGNWKLEFKNSKWQFLADQSKPIDFTKMNMQYRGGGLGVPDALVQIILNDVLSNFIRDILVQSLPTELSKLVDVSCVMECGGEMVIDGLNIAKTVDGSFHNQSQLDQSDQLQHVLGLNRSQLNLLLSTRQYSGIDVLFSSLAQFAVYLKQYALDPMEDDKEVDTLTADWIVTWDRIFELLLLQRHLNPRGKSVDVASINFGDFIAHAKRHVLSKQLPVRIHLTKLDCRFHFSTMLDAISAWLAQSTRVAGTIGASLMGIRLGRKDKSRKNGTPPKDAISPSMLDLQRLIGHFKEWMTSGLLQQLRFNAEGKLTGQPHNSDALIRFQASDIELVAAGPLDWTSSLSWIFDTGRVVCHTMRGLENEPALQVIVETNDKNVVTSATLTDIKSSLKLDTTHLTGDTTVLDFQYGASVSGTQMHWHPALRFTTSVGCAHVVGHARKILEVGLALLRQKESLHELTWKWLNKVIATVVKYCESEALLMAWNVSVSMDSEGMVDLRSFESHPQPFLYYDQVQLLALLQDVDEMVNFSIHLQENTTQTS